MDARNSQFLQRTATNSSGSLQLKSPVSLGAGDFGLYTWRRLVWRCLPWWVCSAGACLGGCPAIALALLGLASALRVPWHLSAWRSCGGSLPRWAALGAPCDCPGAVWSGGCPAFALALLGLASALRLPWYLSAWRSCGGSLPWWVLASEGVLRLHWHLYAWRSCEVLACDSDLVRQGRGLPYKTGSVKDWFGKTRFSRTNWIRRRISLAQ